VKSVPNLIRYPGTSTWELPEEPLRQRFTIRFPGVGVIGESVLNM
jgi:hypothetical protein